MSNKKRIEESGVRENLRTLFRGMWRALCGAFVAASAGAAAYGYTLIPAGGGYEGALVAIGATALLVLSLFLMWGLGGGVRPVRVKEGV